MTEPFDDPARGLPARTEAARVAMLVCGAVVNEVRDVIARRGWPVDVHGLPASYHLRPKEIAPAVEAKLGELAGYERVVVVYGDCGTFGALDRVLERCDRAVRPPGPHCYEMMMGAREFGANAKRRPGTYFLTSWLVRNWEQAVVKGLGLDRHPDLKDVYFGNCTKLVYLRREADPRLDEKAREIARDLGLGLDVRDSRAGDLEERLAALVEPALAA
ncbi:MAG: DUF1638 domain-containing protein [Thermoleophilia bacterium]|nr:DUF1638 domain-containing protein [Thermoleophilia bacterium]